MLSEGKLKVGRPRPLPGLLAGMDSTKSHLVLQLLIRDITEEMSADVLYGVGGEMCPALTRPSTKCPPAQLELPVSLEMAAGALFLSPTIVFVIFGNIKLS